MARARTEAPTIEEPQTPDETQEETTVAPEGEEGEGDGVTDAPEAAKKAWYGMRHNTIPLVSQHFFGSRVKLADGLVELAVNNEWHYVDLSEINPLKGEEQIDRYMSRAFQDGQKVIAFGKKGTGLEVYDAENGLNTANGAGFHIDHFYSNIPDTAEAYCERAKRPERPQGKRVDWESKASSMTEEERLKFLKKQDEDTQKEIARLLAKQAKINEMTTAPAEDSS